MRNEPSLSRGFDVLLSVAEAAERLGVSGKTVWRLIDAGDLMCIRIGTRVLVRPSDLDSFINDRVERRPMEKAAA